MHTRFDFEFKRFAKSEVVSQFATKVLITSLNKSTLCTVVNDPLVSEVKSYGYKGKLKVVYNGTDLKPAIFKGRKRNMINEMFNLSNEEAVFLFVGRIIDIKNIFFILDALKLLKEENYKFKMIYVGEGPDFEKLKNENKGNILGQYIESLSGYPADSLEYQALCEGVQALMETRRG